MPYAYGALYNHPFEGFLLDTLGAGVAFKIAGMSTRQGMCFFTGSTIKTVDDHCGYALPFDPLQNLTGNNAGYHDIHHQSWGIKSNFSQPYFTFWDRMLGTIWKGGDMSSKYERSRLAAQKAVDEDEKRAQAADLLNGEEGRHLHPQQRQESAEDDTEHTPGESFAQEPARASPRKRTLSSKDGFKGLRDRVTGSMHCQRGAEE